MAITSKVNNTNRIIQGINTHTQGISWQYVNLSAKRSRNVMLKTERFAVIFSPRNIDKHHKLF